MAIKKPADNLLETLEVSLAKLMKELDRDPEATLTDKMKVYDRVLKLGAIKLKMEDTDETSGFDDD